MNKQGENKVVEIILLFLIIVICLVLLGSIVNTKAKSTDKLTMTNDSITYAAPVAGSGQINESYQMNITKAQTGWRSTECPISSYTFTNSTGEEYTETTDYIFTAAYGNFTLKNTATVNASTLSNNKTYVSYTYCDEGYMTGSGDRSLMTLIPTLCIIILLVIAVGVGYKWMNE